MGKSSPQLPPTPDPTAPTQTHLYAPHDAILWGMLKDECKWIEGQTNGKIKPTTAANA